MTFAERLNRVMRDGNLRVADLARWFERPDPTVRSWVKGVLPAGGSADMVDIEKRVAALERLLKQKKVLPVPPRTSPRARIRQLQEALRKAL